MNDLIIIASSCPHCGAMRGPEDRFCRNCGTTALATIPQPMPPIVSPGRVSGGAMGRFLDNRWAIVGLLITVGPMGLPFLWWSRRFSNAVKIITTLLYFGLTVVAPLAMAWYWLDVAVRPLADVLMRRP